VSGGRGLCLFCGSVVIEHDHLVWPRVTQTHVRFVLNRIRIGLQMIDVRFEAAVLLLQLFELLGKHAIFIALGAIRHHTVRAEERVIGKQSRNHHSKNGSYASPLSVGRGCDRETLRKSAGLIHSTSLLL
jgi:hypothetical protein